MSTVKTLAFWKLLITSFLLALLAACGGGGGGSAPPVVTPPATFSISGVVSASGVPAAAASGVSVALTGASAASTTSDASGKYTFAGLSNGAYTVTPSRAGYLFNPTSIAVTVGGANQTANFIVSAAVPTFTISGSVTGAAGVNIAMTGATTGSLTTGAAGAAYNFTVPAGTYTLTPSLTGYTFAPASATVTVGPNATAAPFVATLIPVAHVLSGTVTPAVSGVLMSVTGTAAASAVTNASGAYSMNLFDGNYTVTPTAAGYTFTPNAAPVTMAGAPVTRNFTSTANAAVKASVNGSVTGAWIEGALITLSGGGQAGTATTNTAGNYSFGNLPSGQTYTFTPSLTGYTFTPASVSVVIPAGSSAVATAATMSDAAVITSSTISGTVAYAGAKTGAIRIQAYPSGCTTCSPQAGTVIPAPGAYTLRGLQVGSAYTVAAEMDSLGNGNGNANNPSSAGVTVTAPAAGAAITLTDPAIPTPAVPTFSVSPGSGGAAVQYNPPLDVNNQEIATSYKLAWTGMAAGTATFAAQGTNQDVYMLGGLANGAYSFTMQSCVAATCSAVSPAVAATIGPVAGGATVSGSVTYTGVASGPLYVAVHTNGGGGGGGPGAVYVTRVAAPLASPVPYSVTGVPPGVWHVAAIIDNNNNGLIDVGDITNVNGNSGGPAVTVAAAPVTVNVTLSSAPAIAAIGTDHQSTGFYSINAFVDDGLKRVTGVTLFSGPNIPLPVDMGSGNGQAKFNLYQFINTLVPVVGDSYQFKVSYSDGTTAILSASVTGVLNSFATAMLVTNPTLAAPTFSWAAPATPPAAYLYSLNVYPQAGGGGWYYPQNSNGLPPAITSVVYNADGKAPLLGAAGTVYTWQVQVKDVNSMNTATAVATFTH